MKRFRSWAAGWGMLLAFQSMAEGIWLRVAGDDFNQPPTNEWSYAGSTNALGDPLIRHDATNGRVWAEWDQGNHFDDSGDPHVIVNSRLVAPLGRTLKDTDTFRFGATLKIAPGSIPDTLEFYQIANFGLYNLSPDLTGADRLQSDNFSGNSTLVRDAANLMEFNYFINNKSFGFNPFVQGVAIARMPPDELDSTAYFVTGSGSDPLFHDTDMGPDQYLPEGTNLYVQVVYFGRATNQFARRIYAAIYTDPARTNLLTVNGVEMYYWTQPVPLNRTFDFTHMGFVNWAGVNFTVLFGGSTPDGAGAGTFDDLYVDQQFAEGETYNAKLDGDELTMRWAAVSGTTYYVVSTTNLVLGPWTTSAVVTAEGNTASATGIVVGAGGFMSVRY